MHPAKALRAIAFQLERAGIGPERVINTWGAEEVVAWTRSPK